MKNLFIILAVVVVAGGAWFYYEKTMSPAPAPSGAAGLNGSPNQGNLGQPDSGQVQQPGADGAEGSVLNGKTSLAVSSVGSVGPHLVSTLGARTLYTFTKDTGKESTCYDACALLWPPYLVLPEDNVKNVAEGVKGTVDTVTRKDGSIQVTYNGHPLYFYAKDVGSAVNGNGVNNVWFVVKP